MLRRVEVNTFQKRFDSRLRDYIFMWNQGNLMRFLINRCRWYAYPKMNRVASFPLHVDIETTAKCNLRCPMCPSRHVSQDRYSNYGHMDFKLFKTIVDECARHRIFSVRLSWRGEPLVNRRFGEYVHYAKVVKKIPNVSFLTNGTLLTEDISRHLVEYGLDYISVSIDGLKDVYEKIRSPLRFETVYRNLQGLMEVRRRAGTKKPAIRVTTLWPAIARDPRAFYERLRPVCDKIVCNPLKDYSVTEPAKVGFICQFLWERLFVGFNGEVQPCSNTKDGLVVGRVPEDTLEEIWQGSAMERLRERHLALKRGDVFPCNRCSYGIDYARLWKNKDWSRWDPAELLPKSGIHAGKDAGKRGEPDESADRAA